MRREVGRLKDLEYVQRDCGGPLSHIPFVIFDVVELGVPNDRNHCLRNHFYYRLMKACHPLDVFGNLAEMLVDQKYFVWLIPDLERAHRVSVILVVVIREQESHLSDLMAEIVSVVIVIIDRVFRNCETACFPVLFDQRQGLVRKF